MDIKVIPSSIPAVYNPNRSPSDLPSWARTNITDVNQKTIHVEDPDPELDLPSWANKGLQTYMAPFGLDYSTAHTLPGWARRGIDSGRVISVNDFAEQAADIAEILSTQQSPSHKPILKRTAHHNVWEQSTEDSVNVASIKVSQNVLSEILKMQ